MKNKMRLSKVVGLGLVVVFISTFIIFYIVDNLGKVRKKCEENNTIKFCQTNTLTLAVIMLLIILAGLVIVIMTVAYIMISSGEGGTV